MHGDQLARSLQCSVDQRFGEGTYEVLEPLKRGADGYVYKIQFIRDKTPAALKVLDKCPISIDSQLSQQQYKPDPLLLKRAKNEIRIHESLKSSYIVKLRNWGQNQMSFLLILEYCKRGDLGNEIAKYPTGMDMKRVRQIGAELIKGIDTIHKQGVAHMDIKPQNILLGDNLQVKICDFSRAIKIEEITSKSNRVGTRGYAAPEIKDPKKKINEKADIWSYGCTLFHMATGKVPFKGQDFTKQLADINFHSLPLPFSNLLKKIWRFRPEERLTPSEILNHPFFTGSDLTDRDLLQLPQQLQLPERKVGLIKDQKKISQSAENLNKNPALQRWREREQITKTLNLKNRTRTSRRKEETCQESSAKIDSITKMLWGTNGYENLQNQNEQGKENVGQVANLNKKHHLGGDIKKKTTIDELMTHKLTGNKTQGHRLAGKLSPMNLVSLPFGTINRDDQKIIVSEEGLCRYFVSSGKQIVISPCGTKIKIIAGQKSKTYELEKLPEKYRQIYQRSKEIVKILHKSKSSSRPKTQQDKYFGAKKDNKRKSSAANQDLQSNYVSPHFASEVSSMRSSGFSHPHSSRIHIRPSKVHASLEIKLESEPLSLLLEFDPRSKTMLVGNSITFSRQESIAERENKIRRLFTSQIGFSSKTKLPNQCILEISQTLDRYLDWFQKMP